jgi:hypothetical protein
MHSVGANDDFKFIFRTVTESDTRAALILVDRCHFDSDPDPHLRRTQQQLMKNRAVYAKMKAFWPPYRPYLLFVLHATSRIETYT